MIIRDKISYNKFIEDILNSSEEYLGIDTETELFSKEKTRANDLALEGVGIYANKKLKAYILSQVLDVNFQKVLDSKEIIFHNAKFDLVILKKEGFNIDSIKYHDTLIMSWLCNENRFSNKLKDLVHSVLKVKEEKITRFKDIEQKPDKEQFGLFGSKDFDSRMQEWIKQMGFYCLKDCEYTKRLFLKFKPILEKEEIWKEYEELELPFLKVLLNMEERGIRIDSNYLSEIGEKLDNKIIDISADIYKEVGREIDINSAKQLRDYLFKEKKYNLPEQYRTPKGDFSTNVSALLYLKQEKVKIAELILKHRELSKLNSTYIKGMLLDVKEDVIHTSFNQTGTVCVNENTLIVSDKGLVEIKSIVPKLADGEFRKVNIKVPTLKRDEKTAGIFCNGVKNTLKIKTRLGFILEGTLIHPVWSNLLLPKTDNLSSICLQDREKIIGQGEWVKLKDLKIGNWVAIKVGTHLFGNSIKLKKFRPVYKTSSKKVVFPKEITKDLALLVGCYTSEGSMHTASGSGEIRITRKDAFIRKRLAKIVVDIFGINVSNNPDGVAFRSKELLRFFVDVLEIKNGADKKVIPRYIKTAPNYIIKEFIKGLFLDSCTLNDKCGIKFRTMSLDIARWVHLQLLNLGYVSSFRNEGFQGYNRHTKDKCPVWMYEVTIRGEQTKRFIKEIGSLEKKVIKEILNKKTSKNKRNNYIRRKDIVWLKIKDIEKGKAKVFDLNVPKEESFISNGIISHNTGRLSSSSPNCQNIPRRDDEFNIRKAFIPREGYKFISADYSQIELRLTAYFSRDERMLKVYKEDGDIHAETSKKVGCTRTEAKAINFGIIYGLSAYGLSENLNIPKEEAQMFINKYFIKYPRVKLFTLQAVNTMKRNYAVRTLLKRKRRFPDYAQAKKEKDWGLVGQLERKATNAIVQGSAADLIKVAMRNLAPKLEKYDAHILLQIHDELICECPIKDLEEVKEVIKYEMENCINLKTVKIIVEPKITDCWEK